MKKNKRSQEIRKNFAEGVLISAVSSGAAAYNFYNDRMIISMVYSGVSVFLTLSHIVKHRLLCRQPFEDAARNESAHDYSFEVYAQMCLGDAILQITDYKQTVEKAQSELSFPSTIPSHIWPDFKNEFGAICDFFHIQNQQSKDDLHFKLLGAESIQARRNSLLSNPNTSQEDWVDFIAQSVRVLAPIIYQKKYMTLRQIQRDNIVLNEAGYLVSGDRLRHATIKRERKINQRRNKRAQLYTERSGVPGIKKHKSPKHYDENDDVTQKLQEVLDKALSISATKAGQIESDLLSCMTYEEQAAQLVFNSHMLENQIKSLQNTVKSLGGKIDFEAFEGKSDCMNLPSDDFQTSISDMIAITSAEDAVLLDLGVYEQSEDVAVQKLVNDITRERAKISDLNRQSHDAVQEKTEARNAYKEALRENTYLKEEVERLNKVIVDLSVSIGINNVQHNEQALH